MQGQPQRASLATADLPWPWICAVVYVYSPAQAVQAAPQWLHPAPPSFGSISESPAPKSWNEVHPAQEPLTGWTCACSDLDKNCTGRCRWSPAHGSFWSYWWHKSLSSTGSQLSKSHMAKTEWLGNVTIIKGVTGTCPTSAAKVPARTLTTSRISLSMWKSSVYFPWVILSFRGTWPINILTKKSNKTS